MSTEWTVYYIVGIVTKQNSNARGRLYQLLTIWGDGNANLLNKKKKKNENLTNAMHSYRTSVCRNQHLKNIIVISDRKKDQSLCKNLQNIGSSKMVTETNIAPENKALPHLPIDCWMKNLTCPNRLPYKERTLECLTVEGNRLVRRGKLQTTNCSPDIDTIVPECSDE
mmetsp:Transcript_15435/g.27132  ORF Transcript_15435/g.27132 Transcript_15435/m.27132 type:complete len:168 (-) Transcript_15435:230-733(-)